MKKIICELNDNGTTCVNINGYSEDLIEMTACILKTVSETLNMPIEVLSMICCSQSKNINTKRKSKDKKPQDDGNFDISLKFLQDLLNDIYGKL